MSIYNKIVTRDLPYGRWSEEDVVLVPQFIVLIERRVP